MKLYILLALTLLCAGCAAQQPAPTGPLPQLPTSLTTNAQSPTFIPSDPMVGLSPAVQAAITSGRRPSLHQGITTILPYSQDAQWTIKCRPLHATEIRLAPDERTDKDNVILGDTVRWAYRIGGHVVMVEPLADASNPNMTTNLIIATTAQRSYHLNLGLSNRFTSAVSWYYPEEVLAAEAARTNALRQQSAQQAQQSTPPKLNCAYRITGAAPWRPTEVCDNGQNEFIGLAPAPGSDTPTLTVQNGKQQETVNYTQDGQWMKTDRIFRDAVLTSGVGSNQQIVRIEAE